MFERREEYSQAINSPATADEAKGNILVLARKTRATGLRTRVKAWSTNTIIRTLEDGRNAEGLSKFWMKDQYMPKAMELTLVS
jgi:hypothetical protein